MDRLGARRGFVVAIVVWSLAAMAHAEATVFGRPSAAVLARRSASTYTASVAGFIVARFVLGLGEAGNFPAAIKVVAEWFPKRERAFATGLFNSGTNIGALITPLVVPWITLTWGWYWAFVATGALGFAVAARRGCRSIAQPETPSPASSAQRTGATSAAIRRIRSTRVPWAQLLPIGRRGRSRSASS